MYNAKIVRLKLAFYPIHSKLCSINFLHIVANATQTSCVKNVLKALSWNLGRSQFFNLTKYSLFRHVDA